MGTLRKYLFNGSIVSAIVSGFSAFRSQRKGPTDWRTAVTWIAWLLTLVVAIGTVQIESTHADDPKDVKKNREKPAKGPKPVKDPR